MIKSLLKNINLSFFLYLTFVLLVFLSILFKLFVIKSVKIDENKFYLAKIDKNDLFSLYKDKYLNLEIFDKQSVKVYGKKFGKNEKYFYPFNFIEITDNNKKYIYQVIPKTKEVFDFDLRGTNFEVLGGKHLKNGKFTINSIVNFSEENYPIFIIFPKKGKLDNSTEEISILSLEKHCFQVFVKGKKVKKEKIPILYHQENNYISQELRNRNIKPIKIQENSLIFCENTDYTVSISLIEKPISVKKYNRYILTNAKHLRIVKGTIKDNLKNLRQIYSNVFITCNKKKIFINPVSIPIKNNKIILSGENNLLKASNMTPEFPLKYPKVYLGKKCNLKEKIKKKAPLSYPPRGLYISDINAKVFAKDNFGNYKKAYVDFKKVPPLYLEDIFEGQFLSSFSSKNIDNFKIIPSVNLLKISSNGFITVTQKGKIIYKDKENIKYMYDSFRKIREIKIEPEKEVNVSIQYNTFVPACGDLFISSQDISLTYTLGNSKQKRKFNVRKYGKDFVYSLPLNSLSFFKTYKVTVYSKDTFFLRKLDNGKKIKIKRKTILSYKPPLICNIYEKKHLASLPLENFNRILRKKFSKNEESNYNVPLELVPVLGNQYLSKFGIGLLGKGYDIDKLTIDTQFSKDIVKILDEEIKNLYKRKHKLLKRFNENIEAGVVVLRAKDRKIIGVASYPYPKDNQFKKYLYLDILNKKRSSLQNRAFYLEAHPGSTLKILTSIAALEEGVITKFKNRFPQLEGKSDLYGIKLGKGKISFHLRNFRNETTEKADFKHAFAHSYNVYFGYLSLLLNKRIKKQNTNILFPVYLNIDKRKEEFKLLDYALKIGFNKNNGVIIGSKFPMFFTSAKQVADTGIGQFEVMATPLQIATITGTIYDGDLVYPSFLKDEKRKEVVSEFVKSKFILIFNKPTNRSLIEEAMRLVVTEGTAKNAFKHFRYKDKIYIYGKTGTAQKGKGGLSDGWFTAYTKKLNDNDIIVTCLIKNSGTGGSYCGRVVKKIIENWIERKSK